MKYFAKNQYNNIVIINLNSKPSEGMLKYYTAMTEAQETFMAENPSANADEIYNMRLKNSKIDAPQQINEVVLSLDEYKNLAKEGISELSLMTSRKFVSDYQFLNSQASLLVEDGSGIYSHEVATKYIEEYNEIGAKCRTKYYEFLDELEKVSSKEEAETLVNNVTKWYEEL